jgi:hypothetical protein
MKAQLVKRQDRFDLYNESDGSKIASTLPNPMGKLSLKNCQAIENGYDLDELALSYVSDHLTKGTDEYHNSQIDFKEGFQKALEILGDKKFSEEDMKKAMNKIVTATYSNKGDDIFDLFIEIHRKKYMDEYIQSLQQTEWDCIIFVDEKTNQPLLDNEGNLILKRK